MLGPGYLLLRDAVSTPRSFMTDSALGLGDAAPRAVPQDWLLAVTSAVVDGGIVVKAILVGALWAAGWGAAVLARRLLRVSLGPQLVAATVAVWNPYVAERLLQGHWSLLTGYAALPWTVVAAGRIRGGSPGGRASAWLVLGGCLAAAGLTPTGGILAGCVALPLVGRRNLPGALALWCVASAPWLVAAALSGAGTQASDPAGIAAFAARAEPGLATIGSLAGLGGIWNAQAVPGSRTTLFALFGTIVLLALVISGIRLVADGSNSRYRETTPSDPAQDVRARRTLLFLAGVAIVLPALGATGWGLHIGEYLVARIPGVGLLRDTQKYVALAMPAYALCAAAGCRALAARFSGDPKTPDTATDEEDGAGGIRATAMTATLFIALLIVVLPDLAWGVGGVLRPVHYPAAWRQVAARMDGPGDVAVLPGGMFREFTYSADVPVLDPAPRMVPRDVLQTGELPVRGGTVSGEGVRAGEVEGLLLRGAAPSELAARGVGWLLVEHATPGPLGASKSTVARLDPVYSDRYLSLYRVPGPADLTTKSHATDRRIAIAAHLVWAVLLVAPLALVLPATPRRWRPRSRTAPNHAAG
ncbi:hypothetical protein [Nocardia alni]|uniref:hypothetical protein n=1 Tax=Nocardia alni TaxID=2815723 RepID=UPI0020B195B3|nr:hypothetical protein [Nocardia alni]